MYPFLLAIKINGSISTFAAEFDVQNTETKKKNGRFDVTQIIIAQKLDQIFWFCFQYFLHRLIGCAILVKLNIRICVGT